MRIKQSVCYPIMKTPKMSFDELFEAAAKIGYAAVEMWGRGDDYEEVVALAKKNGLVMASMCGHGGALNNRAEHESILAQLRESIDLAAEHGIPGVICFSGNRLPHIDELQAIEATADGLRAAAPYAEKKGVNLNIELLNSKVDHPGYQCDHTAWGVAVCQRVGSPRAKLLYDIYHMQIMEGDVIRTIRQNIRYIGHFHTAGNPDRRDMDDDQELNYRGICRAIAGTGYEYYVGHEFKPKGDPIEAMRTTFALCNGE
ncbi:MAG: TIM barrel protein [Planctomycetes bacterium]|nr:TIM barrel protein [Planctomycetota bacterium]